MAAETQGQSTRSQPGRRLRLSLWHLLLLGLIIRVAIAPFTEHQFDMGTFKNMGIFAYSLHINPLYFWSYGPTWLYIILGVYPFYLLTSLLQPSEFVLNLIIKLPLIVGDLLIADLLYVLSKRVTQNESLAKTVAAAWLFNPLVIFVSSVHGMFDQLPALFTLLSLTLFVNRKVKLSAVSLAVAFSLKLYPIILLPLFIFPLVKEKVSKVFVFLATFLATTFIIYSPYLLDAHTINILINVYSGYAGFGSFLGSPLGVAGLIPYSLLPGPVVFVLSNQLFTLLIPALILLITYLHWKRQLFSFDVHILNRNFALVLLIYFLTYQFIHPQFSLWVLPFLLIAYSVSHQLHGYIYHALWFSIFSWYGFRGFQTFISGAIIPTSVWEQSSLLTSIASLSHVSDFVFVISCILCIASMLSWRANR